MMFTFPIRVGEWWQSRYKLMSCFKLKTSGLRLFILMLIEAVLSLLSAVIDKSNLAPISGSRGPDSYLVFTPCLSESELGEFSLMSTRIIDKFGHSMHFVWSANKNWDHRDVCVWKKYWFVLFNKTFNWLCRAKSDLRQCAPLVSSSLDAEWCRIKVNVF